MARRIEDYALIGDCGTAALVARDGSIDWLCWPRFDGGACFAALLGGPEHGRWRIAPTDDTTRLSRRYRGDTLILETEIATRAGTVTLIDFMPPRGEASDIVRLVVGRSGTVELKAELVLRFDYGSIIPWVTRIEDGRTLRAIAGPDMVVLRTPVKLSGKDLKTTATFTVKAGETVPFVLTYGRSHRPLPRPVDPAQALADTEAYWRDWITPCLDAGRWTPAVRRSLITLKALTHLPTGGIVAAPTTSLPECIGGPRNWDYRFCWLRDATFTLLALMNSGYYDEAAAWRDWLERAVAGSPAQIQIMYAVDGSRRLDERDLPWLPGYEHSRPVRIGNAASGQLQLDIYGEIMDALHVARAGKLGPNDAGWAVQQLLMAHLETIWREPDEGIWEVRSGRRQFTYSKVMAWAAFDRAIQAVERFGLDGPVDRWRKIRDEIHDDVCRNGFNPRLGAFVQHYGSEHLDASLLLMPMLGFLPPEDPRIKGTIEAIERHLLVDGFVLRYDTEANPDGLPPGEGVFLACSFWLADCLLLLGRRAEAETLFERLLGLRNDLGLLSEEYIPKTGRLVGNFPQAFSHIALINTAHNLVHEKKPARQRSEKAAPPPD